MEVEESEHPMKTDEHELRLPAVPILIVEDQRRAAAQLAQLLRAWGGGNCTIVTDQHAARAYLATSTLPGLVILDYRLHRETSVELALWIAARPALRRQLVVVTYTSASLDTIKATLRTLLEQLTTDAAFAAELLDAPARDQWIDDWQQALAAGRTDHHIELLIATLYDGYVAKSTPIATLRKELATRCAHLGQPA
jgi:CheY-like chemotaxis protein